RRLNEALRGQVDDVVRSGVLEDCPDREKISQVRLDERHAVTERLDVLHFAPPPNRSEHFGAAVEGILGEVTAHEPRDPRDQNAHPDHSTTLPATRLPYACLEARAARLPAEPGRRAAGARRRHTTTDRRRFVPRASALGPRHGGGRRRAPT